MVTLLFLEDSLVSTTQTEQKKGSVNTFFQLTGPNSIAIKVLRFSIEDFSTAHFSPKCVYKSKTSGHSSAVLLLT